ncbi:MAG: hypothetical protein V1775_01880 [Bacteroidota bacterium]
MEKSGNISLNQGVPQRLIVVLVLLCMILSESRLNGQTITPGTDLSAELGNRYFDAVDYLRRNTWMSDTLKKEKIQPAFAFGIVFPGLVKYSAILDVMETGATRMLYVQSGRKYSHYEVGRFQMKPSFAELIERNVTRQKMTSQKFDLKNTPKARGERARRLDSQEWQIRYLVMFIRLMDKRFAHIKWKSEDDRLRFYATAFSVGFNRDERTIRRMMTTRSILRRNSEAKSKYRSGDVALWFYVNDGYRFMAEF